MTRREAKLAPSGVAPPRGLYDPRHEHDSCGVGFVAHIRGEKSYAILARGLELLNNLSHRGATGADPNVGDGAGVLIQIPDAFFRNEVDFDLPQIGRYGVGMLFLPPDPALDSKSKSAGKTCTKACKVVEQYAAAANLRVLGWREVPTCNQHLSQSVRASEPLIRQVFVAPAEPDSAQNPQNSAALETALERKLFLLRRQLPQRMRELGTKWHGANNFAIASFSTRVVVYKGMFLAAQLDKYYRDLQNPQLQTALALAHQRFSTNTFPSWDLAHPFQMIAHNGEINTLRGNVNWMEARRGSLGSAVLGDALSQITPLIGDHESDTAAFNIALELLVAGGYSLAHALMLLIPEAWEGNPLMPPERRAFYQYHAAMMEAWDGPAAVAFTDGRQIGAVLDRNGLRPARYFVTRDDLVVLASEAGTLEIPEADIVKKWRLQPGKMLLVDLQQGRIIDDAEIKTQLATAHDYPSHLRASQVALADLPTPATAVPPPPDPQTLLRAQQCFGYTQEDLKFLLLPMLETASEAIGSMGNDVPLPVLSAQRKHLANYFKQKFAQVTNPPIDPIREQLVMSLRSLLGRRPNLFDTAEPSGVERVVLTSPILSNAQLAQLRHAHTHAGELQTRTLSICFGKTDDPAQGLHRALNTLRSAAAQAVEDGARILILSDRDTNARRVPIPALLATAAVHQHLIDCALRLDTGLVVETAACLEVHHAATLGGFGAEAINPYLAFDSIGALVQARCQSKNTAQAQSRYIDALNAGLKKVMSKMGISTYQSYCGAQIFDAVGLAAEFVDAYFRGTATSVEGVGLAQIAADAQAWHQTAYRAHADPLYHEHFSAGSLAVGGDYAWRVRGEAHVWSPETVSKLQHATRSNDFQSFGEFTAAVNAQSKKLLNLRGLFEFKWVKKPIALEKVESAAELVKRFSTGAISFGSISSEAHSTLAQAMNQLGGKSNTGEGGEQASRYRPLSGGVANPNRSAIKQVASGRFGVTAEYLVNADELQIKMAQGAKPGEGGQLPGHKVNREIAAVRHSTPGVGLISPPPHHDIYSIEDLAQLIFDLKNANPRARVSVKLVSETGVGTVAAGVSKAHADHVTISGGEGGTGASPLTSIKHAGCPWEIGLAETHQTLVHNNLRGRIAVQVDGGLRTGRDVAIGALLGADEFGFATAPLVVSGCLMMRKCHLNTCPVGIATQDPRLREKFSGQPEHIINYFFFIAEELRQIMAKLGYAKLEHMVGQMQHLELRPAIQHWKAKGLDYSRILAKPVAEKGVSIYNCEAQQHGLENILDQQLIRDAAPALESQKPVRLELPIRNTHRAFGTMLSGRVAERYGHNGLPDRTIHIRARGCAGQSLGAWLARGITIELEGEANDYVGKGLSGGQLLIYPPKSRGFAEPGDNIIIGNTALYGATSGECWISGVAGERFAVRNSGALAVVEGVGDHGCEYMTGGVVVCLGVSGRNFAAGMSGGIAYILDQHGDFADRCNQQSVALSPIPRTGGTAPKDLLANPLADDEARLKWLLTTHHAHTQSPRAAQILGDWDDYLGKFVKVTPVEYRKALESKETKSAA